LVAAAAIDGRHEDELQIWRLFIGLVRAKATANGVTGL